MPPTPETPQVPMVPVPVWTVPVSDGMFRVPKSNVPEFVEQDYEGIEYGAIGADEPSARLSTVLKLIESHNEVIEVDLSELYAKDAVHDQQIADLQESDNQLQTGIESNAQGIAELETGHNTQQAEIDNLKQADIVHDQQIDALINKDAEQDAAISAIQDDGASTDADLAALHAKDITHDQQIDSLMNKDMLLDADIDALEAVDRDHQALLDVHTDQIAAIQVVNGGQDEVIMALQTNDAAQDSQITALVQKDDALDADIDAVEAVNRDQDALLAVHTDQIGAIQVVNGEQDTAIAALQTKNQQQDTALTGKVAKAGDVMTGNLQISSADPALTLNPVSGLSAIDLRGTASTNNGLRIIGSGANGQLWTDTLLIRSRGNTLTYAKFEGTGTTTYGGRLEVQGSLGGTSVRMAYDAGAAAYYNEIRNAFSGTAAGHTLSFILRQNSVEHTMMVLSADDKIIFNGASIFNGSAAVNLGSALPQAAFHVASGTITDGPMLAMSYTDINYRAMFRGTWSGSAIATNAVRFTMRQGIDGTERTVWTAFGDGLMTVTADPTAPLGVATKQYVDGKFAGSGTGNVSAPADFPLANALILSAGADKTVRGSAFWLETAATGQITCTATQAATMMVINNLDAGGAALKATGGIFGLNAITTSATGIACMNRATAGGIAMQAETTGIPIRIKKGTITTDINSAATVSCTWMHPAEATVTSSYASQAWATAVFAPISHTHTTAQITGLDASLLALQNKDVAQDSSIAALVTKDATHDGQINALQLADGVLEDSIGVVADRVSGVENGWQQMTVINELDGVPWLNRNYYLSVSQPWVMGPLPVAYEGDWLSFHINVVTTTQLDFASGGNTIYRIGKGGTQMPEGDETYPSGRHLVTMRYTDAKWWMETSLDEVTQDNAIASIVAVNNNQQEVIDLLEVSSLTQAQADARYVITNSNAGLDSLFLLSDLFVSTNAQIDGALTGPSIAALQNKDTKLEGGWQQMLEFRLGSAPPLHEPSPQIATVLAANNNYWANTISQAITFPALPASAVDGDWIGFHLHVSTVSYSDINFSGQGVYRIGSNNAAGTIRFPLGYNKFTIRKVGSQWWLEDSALMQEALAGALASTFPAPVLLSVVSAKGNNTFTTAPIDTTGAGLIVIAVGRNQSPVITDSYGNAWGNYGDSTSPIGGLCALYACLNPKAGANHTFTLTGTSIDASVSVAAFSWAGVPQTQTESATSGLSLALPAITPTSTRTLLLTAITNYGADVVSVSDGFKMISETGFVTGSITAGALAYKITEETDAQAPVWTLGGTSTGSAAVMVSFNATVPAQATPAEPAAWDHWRFQMPAGPASAAPIVGAKGHNATPVAPVIPTGKSVIMQAGLPGVINGINLGYPDTADFTACLVMKRQQFVPSAYHYLLGSGNLNTSVGGELIIASNASNNLGIFAGTVNVVTPFSAANINEGDWCFVVLRRSSNLYGGMIGGSVFMENTYAIIATTNNLSIGNIVDAINPVAMLAPQLEVAECIIFPSALTNQQVNDVYNRSKLRMAALGITITGGLPNLPSALEAPTPLPAPDDEPPPPPP